MVTKIDEEFTTDDLIAELQEHIPPILVRKPGGVTCKEWAIAQSINSSTAHTQLIELVEKGILYRERARGESKPFWVYYKVKAKLSAPA